MIYYVMKLMFSDGKVYNGVGLDLSHEPIEERNFIREQLSAEGLMAYGLEGL